MTEYASEPITGLPGLLPPGEHILWQGAPDRRALTRTAFHARLIAGYFVALAAIGLVSAIPGGNYAGVAITVAMGVVGVALLHLLAWGSARTTVYTLTNRRIVMRIGMAVPTCINLPLPMIASVDLAAHADGTGDVLITLPGPARLGYVALWPHARPLRIMRPQPMLRAIPEARTVAALIARTCHARTTLVEPRGVPVPALVGARAV